MSGLAHRARVGHQARVHTWARETTVGTKIWVLVETNAQQLERKQTILSVQTANQPYAIFHPVDIDPDTEYMVHG